MAFSLPASIHFIVVAFILHFLSPAGAAAFPFGDRSSSIDSPEELDDVLALFIRREDAHENKHGPWSYAGLSEYSGAMAAHIICMVIAWIFVLPITVVLSISRHRYALFLRLIFLGLSILGVVSAKTVTSHTEDLYQGNAHHSVGWIAMAIVTSQTLISILAQLSKGLKGHQQPPTASATRRRYTSVKALIRSIHRRWSGKYEPLTATASPTSNDNSLALEGQARNTQQYDRSDSGYDDDDSEYKTLVADSASNGDGSMKSTHWTPRIRTAPPLGVFKLFSVLDKVIDWTILILGYTTLLTGIVTYTGIFRGDHIFNGLAHFIKGSIFIWYGLLTLGRWLGCFASVGWAWNVRPSHSGRKWIARVPSAEFVESSVIFLYGSSNMFLEHLAGWGEAWTASDLEHLSISILFFGGGLLGMLVESNRIRALLNRHINPEDSAPAKEPTTSLNPVPALIILLLGHLMSSHTQTSPLSSTIHAQWGVLLSCFGLLRILTYNVLFTYPPSSPYPSRPPTELLASFCLVVGGVVFCASAEDVVGWLEAEKVMGGLVLTVGSAAGLVVMGWVVVVVGVRRWAVGG